MPLRRCAICSVCRARLVSISKILISTQHAEDVTQTTFLNAYRAFRRGERPAKPENWLIAIAHNVCRMRWRQAGARPREIALDEAPEPVSHDEERPDLDEVLTALAQLSFNQRAALVVGVLERPQTRTRS